MKKIFILTAGFGEGHNAAARGLAESLKYCEPSCEPKIIDLFKECYPRLFRISSRAYLLAINEAPKAWASIYRLFDRQHVKSRLPRFRKLSLKLSEILDQSPHAVVATFPAYPPLLERLDRKHTVPIHTVVTDSITINHIWHISKSDTFITPNKETAEVLLSRGVPAAKIHNLGFPVSRRFAMIQSAQLPDPEQEMRVLYAINSGRHRARNIVRKILALPNLHLTVLAGRDERLRLRLLAATDPENHRCKILGWTDEIPRLMAEHHVLISKAGGATTQEAIASGLPIIIHQIVPGQEAGNAELILKNGWGFHTPRTGQLIKMLQTLRSNHGELLYETRRKIRTSAHPSSADRIARFILDFPGKAFNRQDC